MKEVATINLEKNECKSVYLHYLPFCIIIALQGGADLRKFYLSNERGKDYIPCLEPIDIRTDCGTVIFKIFVDSEA